jgi:hypothetical protein
MRLREPVPIFNEDPFFGVSSSYWKREANGSDSHDIILHDESPSTKWVPSTPSMKHPAIGPSIIIVGIMNSHSNQDFP